ncbi:MAG: tRNA pseudouridine(38-40) synthase TruA [Candidatus Marinimicrobia bacterium]|nr:tRNA pseudouridine(38-40) synthase TruA [Candidatus Neomarinimicrobiota bacterium]
MSLKNYKITISYDGTSLHGWQIQKNSRTVQGDIENALEKIFNQKINLIGAGRTDSGVHALGQVANFKVSTSMTPDQLKNALNGNLERDIFIISCHEVNLDFHSRFSAVKREYIYKIQTNFTPISRNFSWSLDSNFVDINILNECSKLVIGEHDFSQLSKKNVEIENKNCHIYSSKWIVDDSSLNYIISANRFLHHMVRYLVGVMIEVSKKNLLSIDDFESMLNANKRKFIFKAPSKGLYLNRVLYD